MATKTIDNGNEVAEQIHAVRGFNRFYTQRIGVLDEGLLDSEFSLSEARVLYELAQRGKCSASELAQHLALDAGYLSRILRRFEQQGMLVKQAAADDARRHVLQLTRRGRSRFAELDRRSSSQIQGMLAALAPQSRQRLLVAMRDIEDVLGRSASEDIPYILRPPRAGDMGWIVHRHGVLYADEYGWDERFEALVADIVSRYVREHDPRSERCWIAERHGDIVGSVFLVKRSAQVAQLRLLLVEPSARGLGIGARLTQECIDFARQHGYRKMVLWTNSVLHAARCIYEKAGFKLISEEPHDTFGVPLVGQMWELELRPANRRRH
jgi:DNA-binding MarR family transcriptional regulator/GNAT superfamily N-acetyltransferase